MSYCSAGGLNDHNDSEMIFTGRVQCATVIQVSTYLHSANGLH